VLRCADACAANWPPVTIQETGKVYLTQAVDPAAIGAIQRTDGTMQLTVGGRPIYRFAGDMTRHQRTGHGRRLVRGRPGR
jgi:predicted lipoprotein with Yx(FWY)xxD motif